MWHFEKKGEKKENQNKWLKSNVPLYSFTHDGSRSTHDHTLEHPVDSSGRRAAHCSFPPSPSLSLSLFSVPDTSLLSSRPPTPAPSPSFSLFPSVSSLALPLSDKMHTSPYSLSSLFFFLTFPLTRSHALLRENKYQSEVLLDVHFHMPSTNLFLFDEPFQKIFSLGIRQSQSWKANNIRWWD